MASWLYNTIVGPGPQDIQVAQSSASSSSHVLPTEPPPSYDDTTSGKAVPPPRGPLPRFPLDLPALNLLRDKRVVLASASPRRKQILQHLGLTNLEIVPSTFAEDLDKSHYTPWEYVLETATQKCQSVYRTLTSSDSPASVDPTLVLAADTIISLATGEVLEKPKSAAHHLAMLKTLRDEGAHKVYTAVVAMSPLETLAHPGYALESHVEETVVVFDKMVTDELLMAYVKTREGADKAGGYAIQGTGSILVEKIEGSFDNVVGLPLRATLKVIEKVLSNDELEEEDEPTEI